MYFYMLFIIIWFNEAHGEWNLIWSDEFLNETVDSDKWEIENELNSCHGNYIEQLNCNTNSTKNLRLIDGTLALTAIYEKHLDKDYTSGKITTKQGFTYGRFEIRAALPKGKMLRPAIFMIPEIGSPEWARNGQIDIMTNIQTSKLGAGIHYGVPNVYEGNSKQEFIANKSLNVFHTYALEWNKYEFKWFFDDINHQTVNISKNLGPIYAKNGQPFDKPFRLLIHLGVGSIFFPNKMLTLEDVIDWKCSLLILDYVRIYNWVNGGEKLLTANSVLTDKICSSVMPLITPKKPVNIAFTTIISVISLLLLIVLIPAVLFLYLRQKKLKRINIESNLNNYDDICDTEGYDEINTGNEYADPYQELSEYYVEIDGKVKSFVESDKTEKITSNNQYFTMNKAISN